jgi:hypothetical protein
VDDDVYRIGKCQTSASDAETQRPEFLVFCREKAAVIYNPKNLWYILGTEGQSWLTKASIIGGGTVSHVRNHLDRAPAYGRTARRLQELRP